jgi:D-alanyl-D-alanine carboxypeptidase/D-alanyl-D-alanine-endopeptidase (penicillin-binding protein 4)
VTGRVYGDESSFDTLRGGPASGYRFDIWIGGPLTALLYNRGLAREDGSAIQRKPATFAAKQLAAALRRAGVSVARPAAAGTAPDGATEIAAVPSPPIATLARLTLVPSDNLVAEMLLKSLGARFRGVGSTTAGATVVRRTLARVGVRARIADGSGLSRANATSPRAVVRLLEVMRDEPTFRASLAVAGRTGTLARRMVGTLAQGRCQAKTGTLSNVSALAGYCRTRNRHLVAFAFLANGVNTVAAKRAEDRLAQLLARQRPAAAVARRHGASATATPSRRSPRAAAASAAAAAPPRAPAPGTRRPRA